MSWIMVLLKNKKQKTVSYDPAQKKPVILSSICTGEETAGFQDLKTGKFEAVMAVQNENDLKEFCRICGTDNIPTIY